VTNAGLQRYINAIIIIIIIKSLYLLTVARFVTNKIPITVIRPSMLQGSRLPVITGILPIEIAKYRFIFQLPVKHTGCIFISPIVIFPFYFFITNFVMSDLSQQQFCDERRRSVEYVCTATCVHVYHSSTSVQYTGYQWPTYAISFIETGSV
jgi:hypothetical protein